MSYNIMKKRAGFAGSTEGTIENIVDTHTDQTINGQKTITDLTASAFSSSATIYATAFVGDGSGLTGVSGGGGGSAAQGPVESLQFHTGSGGLSGSANLSFLTSSNTLEVTGDISASINISASSFYGDGSNLSNIAAANISGQLSPTQIAHSSPLTNSAGNLTAKTDINRLISADTSGIYLDTTVADTNVRTSVNDSDKLITYNSGIFYSIAFSAIESSLNIGGGNITGSNSIDNLVLPTKINRSEISASTGISGAYFQGDGSGLTGVTGTPTPVGSNTEIQFNADGALGSSTNFAFVTSSNTLDITGNLTASGHVSSSLGVLDEIRSEGLTFLGSGWNYAADGVVASAAGDTLLVSGGIDLNGDIDVSQDVNVSGETTVTTLTASTHVSASTYYGDGKNLSGVAINSAGTSNIVYVADGLLKTLTSNTNLQWDGSQIATTNMSASGYVSASAFYGDGSNLTGISAGGNTFSRAEVTSTPYTASSSDYYIGVNTGSAAIVQLPLASTLNSGQTFIVKDESGNASLYNITVQTSGSDVVDGQSNQTIESDYGSISLYSNGADKFFIF